MDTFTLHAPGRQAWRKELAQGSVHSAHAATRACACRGLHSPFFLDVGH